WRMGMLASNPQFVKWVLKAKSNIDSGQFKPMQLATVVALSNSAAWHADMNRIYAERRMWAEKIMELLHASYDKSQVGLFVWGKLPGELPGSETLVDELLQGARVFITPGSIFGSNGARFIRISLGSSVEKMQEAHKRIEAYLRSKFE
ncbi:MAG TPA: aminotransferase, partial [Porphyromonadaceae bacterium]|nr:aminotransferase [Porphyromonadaceae bacterium]